MSDLALNKRWAKKWDTVTFKVTSDSIPTTAAHTNTTTNTTTINVSGDYIEHQVNNYYSGDHSNSGQTDNKVSEVKKLPSASDPPVKSTINAPQKRLTKESTIKVSVIPFDKTIEPEVIQPIPPSESQANLIAENSIETPIAAKTGESHTVIPVGLWVALGIGIGFIIQKFVTPKTPVNNTVQTKEDSESDSNSHQ